MDIDIDSEKGKRDAIFDSMKEIKKYESIGVFKERI